MFKNFKPINDYVLVQLIVADKKTSGGIIIPGESQESTHKATILHAGKSEQLTLGDKVIFKKYLGTALDDKYIVLKEEEILGVM